MRRSAGEAVSGCVPRWRTAETRDRGQRHKRRGSRVDAPPAACALSRLLEQRLDKRLQLVLIDGISSKVGAAVR